MSSSGPSLPPLRDDGLPTLPTGEPVLQRWFVITLLLLVPVAIGVTLWAFASIDRVELTAAERRPPGGGEVTIERGEAMLAETRDAEPGPGCAQGIRLVGDGGSRAAARRAMSTACELIASGEFPVAREGLVAWVASRGILRIATFELSGVESSTRLEEDRLVMELNAKFQFEDAEVAAPAVIHQLELIASPTWPGEPISAEHELAAARSQARACAALGLGDDAPRGCRDVEELLAADDPLQQLVDAGYPATGPG
jgi:hypothetical protein